MTANETMVANDGYEVMLFPLEYMNISQGENTGSHTGTLQIDFLGWDSNGRVYHCPYYAPCSCRCVAVSDLSTNNRIYQSLNSVHLANGSLGFVTFEVAHDNTPPHNVNDVVNQGELLGYTGTQGYVTGDHVHFQCANGLYAGWEQVPPDYNWQLKNEMHIYDACYINDTIIINDDGYPFKTYDGPIGPTPTDEKRKKFPWVLYARKLRSYRANV